MKNFNWKNSIEDLAPGDQKSASFEWKDFNVVQITDPSDPLLDSVYSLLWREFGTAGELEQKDVLKSRLLWNSKDKSSGYSMSYEILVVFHQNEIIAIRDHSVTLHLASSHPIVHLSHVWIHSQYRGKGLIGWLRAWPIQKAKAVLRELDLPLDSSITLVAEMEPFHPDLNERILRLKSYRNAQFSMVDPSQCHYLQPDFRIPKEIDLSGGPNPLPLCLILRRVGRESEKTIDQGELRELISALYHMYGTSFRKQDMEVVWNHLKNECIQPVSQIRLISPIQKSTPA